MRFLLMMCVLVSAPVFGQKTGADSLKDVASVLGIDPKDLRGIDNVMVSPHKNCSNQDHHHAMLPDVPVISAQDKQEGMGTAVLKVEEPTRGKIVIDADKFGNRGGLGLKFRLDGGKSLSVGAGPKNVGLTGKIPIR